MLFQLSKLLLTQLINFSNFSDLGSIFLVSLTVSPVLSLVFFMVKVKEEFRSIYLSIFISVEQLVIVSSNLIIKGILVRFIIVCLALPLTYF